MFTKFPNTLIRPVICYEFYFWTLWEQQFLLLFLPSVWTISLSGMVFYNSLMFVVLCTQIFTASCLLPLVSIPQTIKIYFRARWDPRQDLVWIQWPAGAMRFWFSCDTWRRPPGPFHKQPVRGASAFALFRFGVWHLGQRKQKVKLSQRIPF